jgi:hypothetical protein
VHLSSFLIYSQTSFLFINHPPLLPRYHSSISPSFTHIFPHPTSSTEDHLRHSCYPRSRSIPSEIKHPPSTIHTSNSSYNKPYRLNSNHSSTTMGTAPRKQLKYKYLEHKQLKRTYKIPRSLKRSIKKNLVKIVERRERKIRDEEASLSLVLPDTSCILVLLCFQAQDFNALILTIFVLIAQEVFDPAWNHHVRNSGSSLCFRRTLFLP